MLNLCTTGASLPDIPDAPCPENFGQVQKYVLIERGQGVAIDSATEDTAVAWTPFVHATDNTKIHQTPFISEPVNEPGGQRTYGGGNATVNGIPLVLGSEPSTMTAKFLATTQDVVKALKQYQGFQLEVMLVNGKGQIAGSRDLDGNLIGFPIQDGSFFISDKGLGGYEAVDNNMINFAFEPDWSDDFSVVTPVDFNGLDLSGTVPSS